MAQYDGSIRIGTGIDEKGFKAGSKELEAGARSLAKSVSDSLGEGAKVALQKQTDAFVKLNQQYAAQEQKVKDIASKLHDMQRQKVETAEFKELSKDLDKAKASLDRLYDRRDSYAELGKKVPPKLDLDISDAERKIKILEADIKELKITNKAYIPVDTSKVQKELVTAEQKQMQIYTALQTSADAISQKTSERIAKEDVVREKIAAEVTEEERLEQIRVNAVASNDQIIAKVERLRQLEQEIADLKAAGITEGYADYDNRIQEISEIKQNVREYRDSLSEVPERFSRMRAAAQKAFNAIRLGFSTIGNIGKKVFSGIFGIAKKVFSGMASSAKKAFSAISSGSRQSSGFLSGFTSQLKNIISAAFVFNLIRKGFSSMVSGVKTGFTNLMSYSESFANSIQSVKNSFSTLGNQIAAAFVPIMQTVIPWLNQFISVLSTAISYVSQFIAALTGKSSYTKAKKVQDSYGASLGGTAKKEDEVADNADNMSDALDDSAKSAKKARGALAAFDDLDVLEKQDESTDAAADKIKDLNKELGNLGGDGAGDLFEEVSIENSILDLIAWLKDMWENSDFYELGKILGEKLKEALESIPWDGIKEIARKIGKSLVTLINGFIEVDGLGESIGRTLAESLNTAFEFLNAFVHELNWDSLGKFISETINGFFQNIDWDLIYDTLVTAAKGFGDAINAFVDNLDWGAIATAISKFVNTIVDTIYEFITATDWKSIAENLGKTLSDSFTGIDWTKFGETVGEAFKAFFDFISTAIENVDWWAVGESVKDFLVGIDWAGVAESFFEAVGAAIGGFAAFIGGLIADGVEEAKQYFQDKIEDAGGNIVEGIFNGIIEAVKDIGSWISEHIFQPFIEGFKEAFGIHSPSTVMAEMGGYLIEGLINGIKDMWESLKSTIGEIADSVIEKFKDVLGIHSPSTVMEEQGNYITEGLLNGISGNIGLISELWSKLKEDMVSTIKEIGQWFIDFWSQTLNSVSAKLQSIQKFFSDTWTAIYKSTSEVWTNIQEWFSQTLSNIQKLFTDIWSDIQNWFTGFWNRFTAYLYEIWENIVLFFGQKFDDIKNMFNDFMEFVGGIISTGWTNAWNKATEIFDSFKAKIENIVDGIKNVLSSFFSWISDLVSDVLSAIGEIGSAASTISSQVGNLMGGAIGKASYSEVSAYSYNFDDVPHLASGSVIRGGNPFIAMLGDQPRGQTNVEAPAGLIKDMVAQGIAESGIRNPIPLNINLNYDGQTFARLSLPDILAELERKGYNVNVLGVT